MNFFDLVNISERYMELVNPASPEKVLEVGRVLGLNADSRVIDFGCGYGEPLALWAGAYGISGIGIDVREHACARAQEKMAARGLEGRIQIVCGDAAQYRFQEHSYDDAVCIGASFIWKGFQPTVAAMGSAIVPGGRLVVGEPYWLSSTVPPEYAQSGGFHTETELLRIVREEGYDLEYVVRSSHDDWDRYESGNWYGLIRWLEGNPDHPERHEVVEHLHRRQDEYFRYAREYLGWAMYVLSPAQS
ncbi:MAG: class I SAM-dependent methyltransferase [Anaerolineae bacterium]|nr:class I SAM-dependent methyltransferase [Anaerolineae bacterium]